MIKISKAVNDMIKWIMTHIIEEYYKTVEIAYGTYEFKKRYRVRLR